MAVAGADVEQLEDAPTHEHLERQGKKMSNFTKKQVLQSKYIFSSRAFNGVYMEMETLFYFQPFPGPQ